eukprot:4334223-Pleurochrysis_carterae.AAC.1
MVSGIESTIEGRVDAQTNLVTSESAGDAAGVHYDVVESASTGDGWVQVASGLTEAFWESHTLRCAEGCSFRVTASNIRNWRVPSAASPFVSTLLLPPPPPHSVRVEIAIIRTADEARIRKDVCAVVAAALGVQSARVVLVEMRNARFVVLDLLPIGAAGDVQVCTPYTRLPKGTFLNDDSRGNLS